MKKLNNKGFMLTETLVVAGFVIATLVFLYTQVRNINKSYTTSFKYNNISELYALGSFGDYLKVNGLNVAGPASLLAESKYLDLSSCTEVFLAENNYCNALVSSLNIKKIILTSENLNELKIAINNDTSLSEEMKQFIRTIQYDDGADYRIIAEFTNGTFATLKIA